MPKNFLFAGLAALITLLVLVSWRVELFSGFENSLEDLLLLPKPIHPDILILAIDDESIARIGQWPWPRETFAQVFEILERAKPKAVGLDVIFSETSRFGKEDDLLLEKTLSKISYPLVLPLEVSPAGIRKPLEGFGKYAGLGHVNLILDPDGIVRKFPPQLEDDGEQVQAFALELYKKINQGQEIEINGNKKESLRIAFSQRPGSVRRIPFARLREDAALAENFKNKIILIGATALDLHDSQLTPLSRGAEMSGVEIQANLLNMFLEGYRLEALDSQKMALWILAAGILPFFFFILAKSSLTPLLGNILLGAAHTTFAVVLAEKGILANLVHLNLAWLLSTLGLFSLRYLFTESEKRQIRKLFSNYVSKEVLEEILKEPEKVSLGGEEREITIFFSDIKDFTTLSERLPSKELVGLLNEYFEAMGQEILKQRGILDKYIGDAVMAFWGAPLEDRAQAENAVQAALGMQKALAELNLKFREKGLPEISIRIGIYTGPAVVGNIGSKTRFDYTVIGDSVNIASRLEGLNKTYHTKIIIGESTKVKLKNDYGFKPVGEVTVKGREKPLRVWAYG